MTKRDYEIILENMKRDYKIIMSNKEIIIKELQDFMIDNLYDTRPCERDLYLYTVENGTDEGGVDFSIFEGSGYIPDDHYTLHSKGGYPVDIEMCVNMKYPERENFDSDEEYEEEKDEWDFQIEQYEEYERDRAYDIFDKFVKDIEDDIDSTYHSMLHEEFYMKQRGEMW